MKKTLLLMEILKDYKNDIITLEEAVNKISDIDKLLAKKNEILNISPGQLDLEDLIKEIENEQDKI
jgi:hypothetical protein